MSEDLIPGKDSTCGICGSKIRWVEQKFPKLSSWEICPLHAAAPKLLFVCEEVLEMAFLGQHKTEKDFDDFIKRVTSVIREATPHSRHKKWISSKEMEDAREEFELRRSKLFPERSTK